MPPLGRFTTLPWTTYRLEVGKEPRLEGGVGGDDRAAGTEGPSASDPQSASSEHTRCSSTGQSSSRVEHDQHGVLVADVPEEPFDTAIAGEVSPAAGVPTTRPTLRPRGATRLRYSGQQRWRAQRRPVTVAFGIRSLPEAFEEHRAALLSAAPLGAVAGVEFAAQALDPYQVAGREQLVVDGVDTGVRRSRPTFVPSAVISTTAPTPAESRSGIRADIPTVVIPVQGECLVDGEPESAWGESTENGKFELLRVRRPRAERPFGTRVYT